MADLERIREATRAILKSLPAHVTLVAAAKGRQPEEVLACVEAGVTVIGHNYVQEAQRMVEVIGRRARWHMIGHLQKNKVKAALAVFDMIETLDSLGLAVALSNRCAAEHRTFPVLIEVNSGREPNKSGVFPEDVPDLLQRVARLDHLRVQGLMTMGPLVDDPEALRPYFRATKRLFDDLASAAIPGVDMRYLSMGMSSSYLIAIEEGANMVRIGTAIFGPRSED